MQMVETEKFLKDLAKWVTSDDWDENPESYGEFICRRLTKMGYMVCTDGLYRPVESVSMGFAPVRLADRTRTY
jgi:hypothetical protein